MMTDQSQKTASPEFAAETGRDAGLIPQVRMMTLALLRSPVRNTVLLLGLGLVAVIIATAYGQVRLNRWNRPFYNALSAHQLDQFLVQLGVFGVIAASLLVLNVGQQWLSQMLTLKLRQGLVLDLVENWLRPRRAFRLAHAGPIGVNPDQRMHEDTRHLTELSATLGIGLLQASILLFAFVDVLWALSSNFALRLGGARLVIPGYMVWAAFVYAGSASLLSYWVGSGLVNRNATRYAREADLRFSLVRVNEHIDAISLAEGEQDEERRIEHDLQAVLTAMRRLVTGITNLTWITAGYGWFTIVAPIIAAAPLYFTGSLSFGGLMMAAGAFNQVQSSLRWFVDNFSTIADWRATLLRVANFRRAVVGTEELHQVENKIELVEGEPGRLLLDGLEIASPAGCIKLKEQHVEIKPAEHVLIMGEPGTGKTLLFRTLAGLWPWGSGRIVRPRGEEILYVPHRAYLPPSTVRELLAYPLKTERFSDAASKHALTRFDLQRLIPRLDETDRWDRDLNDDEQNNLAFARALLHAPRWVIVDELLDTIGDRTLERVLDVLGKELKDTAIIHIGGSRNRQALGARVLHLIADPASRRLARDTAMAA
jgi:vitamin B12/bleomycin/antimicrobial peptide transport system ATP-binding/permease protein